MVDLRPQISKKKHLVNGFLLQNSSRNRFQDGIRASTLRFKLGFVCSVGDFLDRIRSHGTLVFFHHHLEKMLNVIFAKHRRFANHNWLLWSSRWWLKDDTHPVSITFFATLGGWDPRTKFLRIGVGFSPSKWPFTPSMASTADPRPNHWNKSFMGWSCKWGVDFLFVFFVRSKNRRFWGESTWRPKSPPLIQTMGSGGGVCVTPFFFRDFPSWNQGEMNKNLPHGVGIFGPAWHETPKPRALEGFQAMTLLFFTWKGGSVFFNGWFCRVIF